MKTYHTQSTIALKLYEILGTNSTSIAVKDLKDNKIKIIKKQGLIAQG